MSDLTLRPSPGSPPSFFYLEVNKDVYSTNAKKIAFALTYMTKGSAQIWAAIFRQKAITRTTISMGTFKDFIEEFKKSFKHHDNIGNTISWLVHKWMISKSNGASTMQPVVSCETGVWPIQMSELTQELVTWIMMRPSVMHQEPFPLTQALWPSPPLMLPSSCPVTWSTCSSTCCTDCTHDLALPCTYDRTAH